MRSGVMRMMVAIGLIFDTHNAYNRLPDTFAEKALASSSPAWLPELQQYGAASGTASLSPQLLPSSWRCPSRSGHRQGKGAVTSVPLSLPAGNLARGGAALGL